MWRRGNRVDATHFPGIDTLGAWHLQGSQAHFKILDSIVRCSTFEGNVQYPTRNNECGGEAIG